MRDYFLIPERISLILSRARARESKDALPVRETWEITKRTQFAFEQSKAKPLRARALAAVLWLALAEAQSQPKPKKANSPGERRKIPRKIP